MMAEDSRFTGVIERFDTTKRRGEIRRDDGRGMVPVSQDEAEGLLTKPARPAVECQVASPSLPVKIEYSLETVHSICARIARGALVSHICAEDGTPGATTFYSWLRKNSEAARLFEEAKQARADFARDRLADLNKKLESGEIDPQSARVIADNLKWMASRDAPKTYGDKVELSGEVEVSSEKPRDDLDLARFVAMIFTRGKKQLEAEASEAESESVAFLVNGSGS